MAPAASSAARTSSVASASQSTSMPASVAMSRTGWPAISPGRWACSSTGTASAPATRARAGADERQQPALHRALVQLDVVADLEAAHEVEERLQRRAVGVEQQLGLAGAVAVLGVEHAQVAEHLALVGQEGRVAAAAGGQALDVVRHLAREEGLALGAGERELAALGAVDEAAILRQRPILAGEVIGQRGHEARIAVRRGRDLARRPPPGE